MDYHFRLKKISLLLLASSLCWLSNSYAGGYTNQSAPNTASASTADGMPLFSAIQVQGAVKVVLVGQQSRQSETLLGNPKDAGRITTTIQNQLLTIRAPEGSKKALIKIGMVLPLTTLYVGGSANVWGKDIHSPGLNITTDGNSVVYLRGSKLAVSNIQNNSNGNMDIAQISSDYLNFEANGNGRTILVGKANTVNARLTHTAILNARQLHADDMRVYTSNQALAHIYPVSAMYAFAHDDSNIYYYNIPAYTAMLNTQGSGNILRIRSGKPPLTTK